MVAEEIKPLVIQDENRLVIALKAMNPKAFQKSRENGFLWIYLTENGRVLPFKEDMTEGSLQALKETEYGYWAQVRTNGESGEEEEEEEEAVPDLSVTGNAGSKDEGAPRSVGEEVLAGLAAVISSRHHDLPEGSYTTHLFKSGPDKIRKKLGEEAVELILARDRGEVIYEAADLFYHTLVLLEALNIPLSEVLAELKGRS